MSETARLHPGDLAPDFTLPDADGNPVRLASLRGRKVVVYFYPAAMTPGCTRQAVDFRDHLPELERAGYTVLGISPDSPQKLARFRDAQQLTFPLLADVDRRVMAQWGAYGEKQLYGRTIVGVIRSTFVLDEQGVVQTAQYGVRATGHVARLLRDLGVSVPADGMRSGASA